MNDERVAIVNMALEGRIRFDEAAVLLDRLLDLQLAERCIVVPPCREPPWREASEDLGALLEREDPAQVLPSASRQFLRAARAGESSIFSSRLAALDVAELADYWTVGATLGWMFGGIALEEVDAALEVRSCNVITNSRLPCDPVCLKLIVTNTPWPLEPGTLVSESDSEFRETVASLDPEPVETPAGRFSDCLKLTRTAARRDSDGSGSVEPVWVRTVWLASGRGVVRGRLECPEFDPIDVRLAAYGGPDGGGFFPIRPGAWWMFERTLPHAVEREVWRALAPGTDGRPWISVALHARETRPDPSG